VGEMVVYMDNTNHTKVNVREPLIYTILIARVRFGCLFWRYLTREL